MNNDSKADDIVYILMNESMSGYIKIGRTVNLEQRIRSLDNTSTPLPFECFYAARVKDACFVEKQLHDAFADSRVRSNREFFEIAAERVVSALRLAAIEDVTPKQGYVENVEDQVAIDKAKHRRGAFNFAMVDIPVGSILTFSRDPSITCTVLDKKNVDFNGENTSLSSSALSILHHMGYNWKTVAGTDYWQFEEVSLSERRNRMEQEGC
ncbi:MAG: GIY-YIG nuclease family protein [Alphaproteobacteria bacterium]